MLLTYFHDSPLGGHLGAHKTFTKIATNFWWPKMRAEIFQYVRQCSLCQRAKPAQNARVGLHATEPATRPMERLFADFVGPLTRTKRGNTAILVLADGFPKFVKFCPVRRITSQCRLSRKGLFSSLWSAGHARHGQCSSFPVQVGQGHVFSLGGETYYYHPLLPPGLLS